MVLGCKPALSDSEIRALNPQTTRPLVLLARGVKRDLENGHFRVLCNKGPRPGSEWKAEESKGPVAAKLSRDCTSEEQAATVKPGARARALV